MKCPNCGAENPSNYMFCSNCGTPLVRERENVQEAASASWGFIKNEAQHTASSLNDALDDSIDIMEDAAEDLGHAASGFDFGGDDSIDELEKRFSDGVDEWQPMTAAGKRDHARRMESQKQAAADLKPQRTGKHKWSEQEFEDVKNDLKHSAASSVGRLGEAPETDYDDVPEKVEKPRRQPKPEKVVSTQNVRSKEPEINRGSRSGSIGRVIAIILALLAIAAVVGVIIHVLKNGINSGISTKQSAEVTVNPNDPNSYLITVHAKEGSVVVYEFSNGSRTEDYTISHKNGAIFKVAKSDLLPVEPIEGTTCSVTPKVLIKNEDGSYAPIPIEPIDIDVPEIGITFDTPDSFEAANGVVEVKGRVPSNRMNAELTLNGQPLTINEDGSFVYSEKMDKGEYDLEFLGKLGGCSILHKTFKATVNRILTPEEIVVIPRSFVTRALNVENSIRVNGTVPAGATIAVASSDPEFSLKSQPEVDADGNFTFEVNLPTAAKAYPFTIIATLADGTTYERPFCVERPPVYNEYVPTVWPDNYDEMIKPNHVTDMRGFQLKGTISEILYDGDYLTAKMDLDNGHTVVIEYHNHYNGASALEVGTHHVMFGYSTGMDEENLLHLFIWFVQD